MVTAGRLALHTPLSHPGSSGRWLPRVPSISAWRIKVNFLCSPRSESVTCWLHQPRSYFGEHECVQTKRMSPQISTFRQQRPTCCPSSVASGSEHHKRDSETSNGVINSFVRYGRPQAPLFYRRTLGLCTALHVVFSRHPVGLSQSSRNWQRAGLGAPDGTIDECVWVSVSLEGNLIGKLGLI